MLLPIGFRRLAFAAIVGAVSLLSLGSARAQGYSGIDCTNPDFFQDCKYYADVYGYTSANNAYAYPYSYAYPVGAGVLLAPIPQGRFFHRHHPVFRGPLRPGVHAGSQGGGAFNR